MTSPSASPVGIPKSLAGFSRGLVALSLLGSLTLGSPKAQAADGTWTQNASGNWNLSTPAPWAGGNIASGVGFNAYFNTIDITAATTVTLTENLTIGNLSFGDTVSPVQNWTLARTLNSAFELTLQASSGAPLITVDNGTTTISTALAGTQGFTKAGSGTLVLSAANTLTGDISVNAGTLDFWANNANIGNNISLAANTVLNAASTANNNVTTISGNITGSGRINKTSDSSTLVLTGDNTFTGGTNLSGGTIIVGNGLNNGIGTGTLNLNRGALVASDNNARTFANTIVLSGSSNLRFGAIDGATTGLGNLTFTSTTSSTVGAARQWTVNNNTRVTFKNGWYGNDTWNVTKLGTGTLVFDGNITGSVGVGLTVTAGTLILNGTKSTSNAVNVNSGGTFGGNSTSMAGLFTLNAGGAISPGDGGIGTLTATNLTWNGEASGTFAQMKFELGNVGSSDRLSLGSGILAKGTGTIFTFDFLGTGAAANTYTLLTFGSSIGFSVSDFSYTNLGGGLSGTFSLQGDSLQFSVVPEPQTYALLAGGLMAVFFFRRKRSA